MRVAIKMTCSKPNLSTTPNNKRRGLNSVIKLGWGDFQNYF
jgi:hypothetical protein